MNDQDERRVLAGQLRELADSIEADKFFSVTAKRTFHNEPTYELRRRTGAKAVGEEWSILVEYTPAMPNGSDPK